MNQKESRDIKTRKKVDALGMEAIKDLAITENEFREVIKKGDDNEIADKYTKQVIKSMEASRNEVTGLADKSVYKEEVERKIAKIKRMQYDQKEGIEKRKIKTFWLAMIDVDNFKYVNDTYGHDVGDRVLKRIAEIAKNTFRSTDLLTNWGGDEFVFLIDNEGKKDDKNALMALERFRQAVQKEEFIDNDDRKFSVTVSIGVAKYNKQDNDIDETFRKSDKSLLIAKGQENHQELLAEGEKLPKGSKAKNGIYYYDTKKGGVVNYTILQHRDSVKGKSRYTSEAETRNVRRIKILEQRVASLQQQIYRLKQELKNS